MDMTEKKIPTPDAQPKEPCFEDAFMDILSGYISLCLEATESAVDVIYAMIFQNADMQTFNAFFRKDGEIRYTHDLMDEETLDRFLDIGIDDIEKLTDVFDCYDRKCPHEIKMIYNVKTKQFDAALGYRDYDKEDNIFFEDLFLNWANEEKAKAE